MILPPSVGRVVGALPQLNKLRQAAGALEADLFKQFLRAASPKNGPLSGSGPGAKIYEDMWQQALADRVGEAGTLGVARTIVEKMAPTVIAQSANNSPRKNTGSPKS